VADHTASLAVNLEDGTSAPALTASKALRQLQDTLAADTKALVQMQKALKNMNGGTSVNIAQAQKLRAAIAAKKQAVAQGTSSIVALGGNLTRTPPKVQKVASAFEQLTQQASAMPGPMGGLLGRFSSLSGLLAGGAMAVGIMAVVTALVALTAATVAAIAALASYGIAQADARRSELLRLEGLTKMRFWYKAAAGSATELQTVIDQVSDSSALGRDEVAKYTTQLYKMGLRGDSLAEALEGVAIKATTQGDAAAQAFAGMAAGAALSGRSVKAMSDVVRARLGGIAAKQLLSLDVQTKKLKESFGALFRDLKIEGLLTAMREVAKIFSQSTITGRALKTVIESVVQLVTDGLAAAMPYVKRFFQGMIIGALLLLIVFLKLRNALRDTFADSKTAKGFDGMNLALNAGIFLVSMLVAGVLVLGAVVALLAAPFIALAALVYGIAVAVSDMWNLLASGDWGAIAKSIVDGLVKGLKLAGQAILGPAMMELGSQAWKAFASSIGFGSPSKEFAKLGLSIPQGVAMGVEQGTPSAQGAVNDMVGVPSGGGAGGGAAARGPVLSIGELHFHAADGSQNRSMAEDFRHELERVLEGLALSLGAPVPGAA
jgi:hypothetical protein